MIKPKILNKRTVIENSYWKVFYSDFIDSQNRKGNVITMKPNKEGNGSFILGLTNDNKIILTKNYKFGPDDFIYTLPSGFIQKGLDGEENILKELAEETGYKTDENIIYLGKTFQNGYIEGYNKLYFSKNCYKFQEQETHEGEEIETLLVTIDDFENMLKENKILDSYSEICFYRVKEYTNNFKNI